MSEAITLALMQLNARVESLEADLAAARAETLAVRAAADKAAEDAGWARGMLEKLQVLGGNVQLPILTIDPPRGDEAAAAPEPNDTMFLAVDDSDDPQEFRTFLFPVGG